MSAVLSDPQWEMAPTDEPGPFDDLPAAERPPSLTGRSYMLDAHQAEQGDALLHNGKWYRVQVARRVPNDRFGVVLHLHSDRHGFSEATLEECQPVRLVPRAFVRGTI